MRYCPDCGEGHECEGQAAAGPSDAVRIAEIERDQAIQLARIAARTERDWNETNAEVREMEAGAAVDVAVAEAAGVAAAAEVITEGGDQAAAVIELPGDVGDGDGDDVQAAEELPPADASPEPPAPAEHKRGLGMW